MKELWRGKLQRDFDTPKGVPGGSRSAARRPRPGSARGRRQRDPRPRRSRTALPPHRAPPAPAGPRRAAGAITARSHPAAAAQTPALKPLGLCAQSFLETRVTKLVALLVGNN